jgi:L-arabinokinase
VKHFVPAWQPPEGAGVLVLFRLIDDAVGKFFDPHRTVFVARAPGRLDLMGGIADYSGSLVLQMPIAESACAAAQARDDDTIAVWSPVQDGSRTQFCEYRLGDLGLPSHPLSYQQARALFAREPSTAWSAYLLGALLVLAREKGARIDKGLVLLLRSDVPEGKGVSSSAAVEVAAMRALADLLGVALDGRELALLSQKVENEIVGAPCGVMDQMTAVHGEQDKLLALRCQPCEIEGQVSLPPGVEVLGLDSGVRHAVSGSDYGAVRAGAFIGYRMLAELRGLAAAVESGTVSIADPEWRGYLANCTPAEFAARFAAALPDKITGGEFLARFHGTTDHLTRIDRARGYAVLQPTRHPIDENARVERFRQLLQEPVSPSQLGELGDLMFASHRSYSACGLGSEATDFIVDQVMQRRQRGTGLWGAKITGGGSGGTVAILGERGKAWHEVLRIKKAVADRLGHPPELFRWSSPGALQFGALRLEPRHN